MARYSLIIFDFDGTLVDSAPWFMAVLNDIADQHRFRKVNDDEIAMLRGRSSREILEYLGIDGWRLPLIARDVRKRSEAAAGSLRLFAGVPELLSDLAEVKVTVAVVSSNSEVTIRKVLGPSAAAVRHYACGASLFGKARKLEAVRRRFGLNPGQVLYVGDEVRDIEAARETGLASGAVTWGYASEAALVAAAPTLLFRTVVEIRAAVTP